MNRGRFAGFVLLTLALSACPARAEKVDDATRSAARNLGQAGVEAYQAGDFATASTKLEKAYKVLQAPTLGLWSARALAKVGKLVEASERYLEVIRLDSSKSAEPEVQRKAQADAQKEQQELSAQIPNVVVTIEGADAESVTVTIDGAPLLSALIGEKRPINPGKHLVSGTLGADAQSVEVTLAPGETKDAVLKFGAGQAAAPAAAAPSQSSAAPAAPLDSQQATARGSSTRTIGFVALGVGGAGLVLGGVAGVLALGKKGEIDDSPDCADNQCLPSQEDTVNSYSTWRTVSSVGLIGGAVLAATGAVLVLTAPREPERVSLRVGPAAVAIGGKF